MKKDFEKLLEKSYILVGWPEIKNYMKYEWFEKESIKPEDRFSGYFIPVTRYIQSIKK